MSVGEEEYKVSPYQLQMELQPLYVGEVKPPNYPFMRPFKGVITPLITIVGAHLVEHGGKKKHQEHHWWGSKHLQTQGMTG